MNSDNKTKDILSESKNRRPVSCLYYGDSACLSNKPLQHGWTKLHDLAFNGILNESHLSGLSKEEIDIKDKFGQTPLWWATQQCNLKSFNILINNGANVHQQDNQERTLLHAVTSGENINCITIAQKLLKMECSLNNKDGLGNTPLDDANRTPNPINRESMYKYNIRKKIKEEFLASQ